MKKSSSKLSVQLNVGLRKHFVDHPHKNIIIDQIKKNAKNCTKITRLASLLINYVFNKMMDCESFAYFDVVDDNRPLNSPTEQLIKDFFYAVLAPYNESEEYPMQKYAHEFLELMIKHEIEPPTNDYLDNSFKHQYQQFHTNFKNNIIEHAEKRVKKLLKMLMYSISPVPKNITSSEKKDHHKAIGKSVQNTQRFLFEGSVEHNSDLLKEFLRISRPNIENPCGMFDDLQHDWFKLLPIFFRIQRFYFAEGKRNFIIVPQTSFQRRHILIDTNALYALHAQLKIVPMRTKTKKMLRADFTKHPKKIWATLIDYAKIKTLDEASNGDKQFGNSIMTDGLSLSVICDKVVMKMDDETNLKKCQKLYEEGFYKKINAYDPGKRLTLGGVHRNPIDGTEENIRIPCGKVYRYANDYVRNKAKSKIDKELQLKTAWDRALYLETPSSMSVLYFEYAEHVLRFFNESLDVYCQQNYARLNFQAHMDKSRALDRITKELTQNKPTLVFIGNGGQSPGIKGYRATPNAKTFVRGFRRRTNCDALLVPENRTTMLCSLCRTVMDEPNNQPKMRYRTCLDCEPKPDCLQTSKVTTIVSKRKLQRLRKRKRRENLRQICLIDEDVNMNQPGRLVSKLITYVKTDEQRNRTNKHGKVVVVWNRDVNAGRNIMYRGLCMIRGVEPDPVFTVRRLSDLDNTTN